MSILPIYLFVRLGSFWWLEVDPVPGGGGTLFCGCPLDLGGLKPLTSSAALWVGQGIWLGYPGAFLPIGWPTESGLEGGKELKGCPPPLPSAPIVKYGGRHTVTMIPGDGIGPRAHAARQVVFRYRGPWAQWRTRERGTMRGSEPVAGGPLSWCLPSCQAEPGEGEGGTRRPAHRLGVSGAPPSAGIARLESPLGQSPDRVGSSRGETPPRARGLGSTVLIPLCPQACMCACGL